MGRLQKLYELLRLQYNDTSLKNLDLFQFVKSLKKDIKGLSDFEFAQYCEYVKDELEQKHKAGQHIGIIVAQSIGELNTQQSLDAKGKQEAKARKKPSNFRMIEKLIEMSGWKYAPDIVYFNIDNPLSYYYEIKETKFKDIVIDASITDSIPKWCSKAEEFFHTYLDRNYPVLKYKIDMDKLRLRNIKLWQVVDKIQPQFENIILLFSEKNEEIVIGTYEHDTVNENLFQMCIHGVENVSDIYIDKKFFSEGVKETVEDGKVICKFETEKDSWIPKSRLKRYLEEKYSSTKWKGNTLLDIKQEKIVQPFEYFFELSYNEEYKFKERKKTLIKILKLPFVDRKRTYVEHIDFILQTQGKEAAQCFFEKELNRYSGNKLNLELIRIGSNSIFARDIMKITRAGYKSRENIGWISSISFEEKDNVLEECAFYGANDDLTSTLSSLAMAQKPNINYKFK